MTTTTRNEAAERLLDRLLTVGAWTDYENEIRPALEIVLSAERRAAVAKVREAVERYDVMFDQDFWDAILADSEVER